MTSEQQPNWDAALTEAAAGNPAPLNARLPELYDLLRAIAKKLMKGERPGHALQATELVHEAWVRLCGGETPIVAENRNHAICLMVETMRRVLVDCARSRDAGKRGGGAGNRVTLSGVETTNPVDVLDLDDALNVLALQGERGERAAKVAELRYIGGYAIREVAELLDISERTVVEAWRFARPWLGERMDERGRGG